jgi:uncharacterized membrane protein YphA (DoxX/SURF4 family)
MRSNTAPPTISRRPSGETLRPGWPGIGMDSWRAKAIAALRTAFGVVWACAAWWKWQPAFQNTFVDQIAKAQSGQPQIIQAWISWWVNLVNLNPLLFARVEALTETALAVGLLLGLFSNLTCVVGMLLALGIWTTAEGFGGPFQAGVTTDIGTALPYLLLFGTLFVVSAGQYYSVDRWLTSRLGSFGFLASGPFPHRAPGREFAI